MGLTDETSGPDSGNLFRHVFLGLTMVRFLLIV
jgi:hypothetical protein